MLKGRHQGGTLARFGFKEQTMQTAQPNLLTRDDTFFGVCQGLGEDLGFHPNLLRVPLAAMLLWNPLVVFGLYLGLGLLVAFTRWVSPDPSPVATAEAAAPAEAQPEELAIAA